MTDAICDIDWITSAEQTKDIECARRLVTECSLEHQHRTMISKSPYLPGKPVEELERELGIDGSIKLASNESPLGPSPHVVAAICREAPRVHLYPDGGSGAG